MYFNLMHAISTTKLCTSYLLRYLSFEIFCGKLYSIYYTSTRYKVGCLFNWKFCTARLWQSWGSARAPAVVLIAIMKQDLCFPLCCSALVWENSKLQEAAVALKNCHFKLYAGSMSMVNKTEATLWSLRARRLSYLLW